MKKRASLLAMVAALLPGMVLAASEPEVPHHWGKYFMMLAIVILVGQLGKVVRFIGMPDVVGQLILGIALSGGAYAGITYLEDMTHNFVIAFTAIFGAALLLKLVGLESNLAEMLKVGMLSFWVALIGIVAPFAVMMWGVTPILYPDMPNTDRIFFSALFVATSISIPALIFRQQGISNTRVARIVLGAAVLDDVEGLIILAVVSGMAVGSGTDPATIVIMFAKSFGFLIGAIAIGRLLADWLSRMFSRISTSTTMMVAFALSLAFTFGYLAELFGLEMIIGAFAAGLVLDGAHFTYYDDPKIVSKLRALDYESEADRQKVLSVVVHEKEKHIEDLIGDIGGVFIPVFFVYTGMQVDFASLLKPELYLYSVIIAMMAIVAKLISGLIVPGPMLERMLVGISMAPRGEVGLIFASTGVTLGVLTGDRFSVGVIAIILTTIIPIPFITRFSNQLRQA